MKVIDLYNMAVQGEIPKKIKMDDKIFIYNKTKDDWLNEEDYGILDLKNTIDSLTHTVEIIEEEKEIEEIDICTGGIMGFDGVENITGALKDKINELVREVRKLKNK